MVDSNVFILFLPRKIGSEKFATPQVKLWMLFILPSMMTKYVTTHKLACIFSGS